MNSFKFDRVFRPWDNQEVVSQTKLIATSILDGFNVCILSLRKIKTGKTFAMDGTPEESGINYRTLEELIRIFGERKGAVKYELNVSMLEVYNEKIRDLLIENSAQSARKLEMKQVAQVTQQVRHLLKLVFME